MNHIGTWNEQTKAKIRRYLFPEAEANDSEADYAMGYLDECIRHNTIRNLRDFQSCFSGLHSNDIKSQFELTKHSVLGTVLQCADLVRSRQIHEVRRSETRPENRVDRSKGHRHIGGL